MDLLERKIPSWQSDCQYTHLTDLNSFPGFSEKSEYVSIDFETTGLDRIRDLIVGMSFSWKRGHACYISIRHEDSENVTEEQLLAFLNKHFKNKTIIYWNARFDRAFIKRLGFKEKAWLDAAIYSYIYDVDVCAKNRSSLKNHAIHYLGVKMLDLSTALGVVKKRRKKGEPKQLIEFHKAPVDSVILAYACADADVTLRLFKGFKKQTDKDSKLVGPLQIDHKAIEAIDYIEKCGLRVDVKFAVELRNKIEAECEKLQVELSNLYGAPFNPASSKQTGDFLYNKLNLPVIKRSPKTNAPSSSREVIEDLALTHGDEIEPLQKLNLWRQNKKILSSYIIPVITGINPYTGCVHPHYNNTQVVTGRLSGAGDGVYMHAFNGQSIPKSEVRRMFIPDDGHTFVSIDLSNIEVRIIAHYSEDPALLKMFADGEDMHDTTTRLVFGAQKTDPDWSKQRKKGKVLNFCLAYAFSPFRLSQYMKVSEEEALEYYNMYFHKAYPQWGHWKQMVRSAARNNPILYTWLGRRRNMQYEYDIGLKADKGYGNGDRKSVNYLIQGTCADLLRYAMAKSFYYIKSNGLLNKVKMNASVHDELCFSIPGVPGEGKFDKILKDITDIMEFTPKDFVLPVKASPAVGPSWWDGDLVPWRPGISYEVLKVEEEKRKRGN